MDVGAIGGAMAMGGAAAMSGAPAAGASAAGGTAGASLTGQVNPNSAPPPTTVAEFLSTPMQQAGMQQLADVMGDYSFSKLLFTMMMLSAMEKDDKKSGGAGAAAGFMAGLAFASQFGRNMNFDLQSPVQNVALDGGAGANINLMA